MAAIRLVAVRSFTYTPTQTTRLCSLTAGEAFESEPIDAAVLVYQHKATFASSSPPARQVDSAPEDPPRRRRYRRRDLRAET